MAKNTLELIAGQDPPAGGYDIDICILSHGRVADTVAAIQSAVAQSGALVHVLVLDQGSSAADLARLVAGIGTCQRVTLYRVPANLGVPGGRNALAAAGHGAIIIGLDNDAVFAGPDVAARAAREFTFDPGLAALGFGILNDDGSRLDQAGWGYPQALQGWARFMTTTFVGAGHALRRTAFEAVGGYDAGLFFTWEEYDLGRRLIAAGWRLIYDRRLAVWHKNAGTLRVSWRGLRTYYFVRNRIVIARKWHESLALLVAGYLLKGALQGRLLASARGVLDGLSWPLAVRRQMDGPMRCYIQAHETVHRGGLRRRIQVELLRPRASG